MNKYNVKILFTSPYLQARFSEEAQSTLSVKKGASKTVKMEHCVEQFSYKDEKGYYMPNTQIRQCLVEGAKKVIKKAKTTFKTDVQSFILVTPERIHLGKKKPDSIEESYPKRKDGNRVVVFHPRFDHLQVEFELTDTSGGMVQSDLEAIFEQAGLVCGIGARRPDAFGRFILKEIKETKK